MKNESRTWLPKTNTQALLVLALNVSLLLNLAVIVLLLSDQNTSFADLLAEGEAEQTQAEPRAMQDSTQPFERVSKEPKSDEPGHAPVVDLLAEAEESADDQQEDSELPAASTASGDESQASSVQFFGLDLD